MSAQTNHPMVGYGCSNDFETYKIQGYLRIHNSSEDGQN
jgi:hypothetical protein